MRIHNISAMPSVVARTFPFHAFPLKMDHVDRSNDSEKKSDHLQALSIHGSHLDVVLKANDEYDNERIHPPRTKDELFRTSYIEGTKYQKLGEFEKALLKYKVALQSKYKTIESEPTDIQEAFCNILYEIGEIHFKSGLDDATKCMEALYFCLDLRRSCLGSCHRGVALILTKLASIHAHCSEHERALDLLLEALSIFLVWSTPEDEGDTNKIDLINVWNSIGYAQQALGYEEDAQSSFEEALKLD
jgi:tetratricopeptide (TPR) repeat protein